MRGVVILAALVVGQVVLGDPYAVVCRREPLHNARVAMAQRGGARVGFMGGSITEMEGYRPLVCAELKRRFPDAKFDFVAAGISSTCSHTGAFRLPTHVLDKGPLDLFFVEFAVNDDQDAHHGRTAAIRGMEGVIRQVRRVSPNTDIVMVFFVNEGMIESLRSGKVPLSIEAHTAVAEHYGVPTINVAREVAGRITAGTMTWEQYGGVHPALPGNQLCVDLIAQLLDQEWAGELARDAKVRGHVVPAQPLDEYCYSSGRFLPLELAECSEQWRLGVPVWSELAGSKRSNFTKVAMLSATAVGAELKLDFEGRAVGLYLLAGPDAGGVEYSVDGGEFKKCMLYHSYSAGLHYPRTVVLADELEAGKHRLVMRVAERGPGGGSAVRILHFVEN